MNEFKIQAKDDKVVLYFGTATKAINAYTLASSLISFADAATKANARINPGYEIEVVVESLADGSFKAILRAVYKTANNLFSYDSVKAIVLGIVASAIYEHAFQHEPKIIIQTDEVIIEQGENRLIIPRTVYDKKLEVEKTTDFKESVNEVLDSIKHDTSISTFGITHDDQRVPELNISRENYHVGEMALPEKDDKNSKVIIENVQLEILKALLERGRRKWEFVWRGVKISGPITDEVFYQKFFSHEIKIAPGDILIAKMKIFQRRLEDSGIYTNEGYEIFEVERHEPKIKPDELSLN